MILNIHQMIERIEMTVHEESLLHLLSLLQREWLQWNVVG